MCLRVLPIYEALQLPHVICEQNKIIYEQDAGLFMAALDIDSLFTNVPLEETINICVNELFKSNSSIHGL